MFRQLLTPVGDSLGLSFLVAILPIVVVLVLLGVLRRPAWQAALAALVTGLIVAVAVWQMPVGLALNSVAAGAVLALWPVMWIVVNALLLYNIAVKSGRFDAFRAWVIEHLPNDRRVVLVVIGFCFGALLEGIAGFGTPVAITSSLLILVGFPALEALVFVLIFNTAPVAFGALGVPVTVLGAVTGLPTTALGAMVGRQLPVMALILPFYVMAIYGGMRSVRALWPVLLVAGGSFAATQFVTSNFLDYALTDVLASLGSLIVTLLFLQVWRPMPDPEFGITEAALAQEAASPVAPWQGWLPWLIVSALVIVWTHFGWASIGQESIKWPGLHNAISITLYNDKPYGAVWAFQPLGTGTAILVAAIIYRGHCQALAGRVLRMRRQDLQSGVACDHHRDAHHRARLSDELFRDRLYAWSRGRLHRVSLRAAVALPRMGRGDAVGQRYVGQRALRQSAGRRRAPAEPEPGPVRRHQLVRRRDGQDDLAAEHRHRRFGDQSQGPRRRGVRPHLLAQHRPDPAAQRARRLPAVRHSLGHSGGGRLTRGLAPVVSFDRRRSRKNEKEGAAGATLPADRQKFPGTKARAKRRDHAGSRLRRLGEDA